MALFVSIKSAILVAVILQAMFVGFSTPDTPSNTSPTNEMVIHVHSCNKTCNPSMNVTCSMKGCICVLVDNATEGYCYSVDWNAPDYYNLPSNESLQAAAPRYD
ncbi:evasin P1126-like [Dermacentor silvarum]|uniref:evasin P1126-like n=1 Tax=Dermacentor silvarum TaxID=543639 RepID=UPI0021010A4B|nr:evasin P1126-like isoform X1 [Dermacentor silvarum]XP_049519743.1 evasin P1126-like [Dermacentor silvarum]